MISRPTRRPLVSSIRRPLNSDGVSGVSLEGHIDGETALDAGDTLTLEWIDTGVPRGSISANNPTPSDQDSITYTFTPNATTYQWYQDGVAIDGATDNPLEIEGVTVAQNGDYTILVTDTVTNQSRLFGPVSVIVTPTAEAEGTGGIETDIDISGTMYRLHEFNVGTSTFTVANDTLAVKALIVAGGGGTDRGQVSQAANGGAGGGQVIEVDIDLAPGDYTVIVGDGGIKGTHTPSVTVAANGGNSSAFGYTAAGGIRGPVYGIAGNAGYNASGASREVATGRTGGVGTNFSGGNSGLNNGGGGAGQGGAGANATTTVAGAGGAGVNSTITGSTVGYGGGGGAGARNDPGYTRGTASHGGGQGGQNGDTQGSPGTAKTGGGAGGRTSTGNGNDGGSGVVYVRWAL